MPATDVPDENGEVMRLMDIDGYFLPELPTENQEEEFRTVKDWKARENDVIICAYPKSGADNVERCTSSENISTSFKDTTGTHWLWEITSMLLNGKAEHIDTVKEKFELEFLPQSAYNSISSPRVLNSHLYFKQLPTDTINKQCKIVYIDRNPKDVAVSFYNHHKNITVYQYDGKWENYCYRFMRGLVDFGSWFDYVKNWENVIKQEKDYPVHLINYEDLKENGFEEVKKLAKFLGVEEDIQLFKSIYEVCQFDNLKKKKDKIEELDYWKNSTPGMYRKGIAGDWKNWFTVKQNEDFNQIYEDKMKDSKLKFKHLY